MASLAQMNFESDSEDDPDFTLEADADSDKDANSQASAPSAKRTRLEEENLTLKSKVTEEEARASAWATFQAKVADPSSTLIQRPKGPKIITIEKRYIFAGEEVIKTIEVEENSKEGKAWLAAQKSSNRPNDSPLPPQPIPATFPPDSGTATTNHHSPAPVASSAPPFVPASIRCIDPPSNGQPPKPSSLVKAPPKPKMKGGGLASLNRKCPPKLSTLEKSRMDWNTHVTSEGDIMKEELDANRRSGGYIEKVEFLGRVSERMEDAFESVKGGKRKR